MDPNRWWGDKVVCEIQGSGATLLRRRRLTVSFVREIRAFQVVHPELDEESVADYYGLSASWVLEVGRRIKGVQDGDNRAKNRGRVAVAIR